MSLIKDLITRDMYGLKCPYTMTPKGICVHNTANDATARNEGTYMKRNNSEVSFHIAIDDIEAIQFIPFTRNAWHSGDGALGEGNRNYIAVEICYSKSGGLRFINAEKRASKEIALLLKQYGWTINNVKKHQDFSNKYCPHLTLDLGWTRFLNMVKIELDKLNNTIEEVKAPITNSSEEIIKEYKEQGVFTCTVDSIYFRNNPNVSNSNPIQGQYFRNETVNYDYVVITNKYVYIGWISASSGIRRYMPVRDKSNGEVWGTFR